MEKIPFFDILVQSWHVSFSKFALLFFGFFIALPEASQNLFLPSDIPDASALGAILLQAPDFWFLFFFGSFLGTIFGKGNLIRELSLHQEITIDSKKPSLRPSLWFLLKKMFLLEGAFWMVLLGLMLVLATPSFISYFFYETVPEALFPLSLLIFLPTVIIIFFIRQFAYYYFLLSPLPIKSALERSLALLLRHRSPSFSFGVSYFFLLIVFTFSLTLAMLGGVALVQYFFAGAPQSAIAFTISLFFLSWFAVFEQALWWHFFLHLARPKKPELAENDILLRDGGTTDTSTL